MRGGGRGWRRKLEDMKARVVAGKKDKQFCT
jgi:hypothetical protein